MLAGKRAVKHEAPKKNAPKAKAEPNYEKAEYKKLEGQVESDIKKEGKAGPKELGRLAGQVKKDIRAEKALTDAGMGHPDAKALAAAGIPEDRVKQLTQQYAPQHPANAGAGFNATPSDPQQYAADVLKLAGLPDTASNEKLLEDQMTVEGMPGGENNPLATSVTMPGSKSVNSAGVQEYPSLIEGAQAEAATLEQPNMASIANALKSGTATPQDYAKALAGSAYEGYDPAANAAYANSFLQDAGLPEQNFPGGGAVSGGGTYATGGTTGGQALADAASSNIFGNLGGNLFAGAGVGAQTNQSLQSALAGLSANPEQTTLSANTTGAPGSPDQATSASQKTNVNPAALYQAQLASLLPGITPGSAGKNG